MHQLAGWDAGLPGHWDVSCSVQLPLARLQAIPNSLELSSDERVRELVALVKEHLAAPVATEVAVEEA